MQTTYCWYLNVRGYVKGHSLNRNGALESLKKKFFFLLMASEKVFFTHENTKNVSTNSLSSVSLKARQSSSYWFSHTMFIMPWLSLTWIYGFPCVSTLRLYTVCFKQSLTLDWPYLWIQHSEHTVHCSKTLLWIRQFSSQLSLSLVVRDDPR